MFEKPGSATFRGANRLPGRTRPAAASVPGQLLLRRRLNIITKSSNPSAGRNKIEINAAVVHSGVDTAPRNP